MTAEATTFAPLDPDAVPNYLRRVDFTERLVGYKMTPTVGNSPVKIRSMAELVEFLLGTRWRSDLMDPSWKSGVNWIDTSQAVAWIRDVIGDTDLADAAGRSIAGLEAYKDQVDALRPLFAERVAQYRAALGEEDAG